MNKSITRYKYIDFASIDISSNLKKYEPLFSKKFGIFQSLFLASSEANPFGGYNALLQLGHSLAIHNWEVIQTSEGSSFNSTLALLRAIGEAIERLSAAMYDPNTITFGTYKDLSSTIKLLDPTQIPHYTEKQLKELVIFQSLNEESQLGWCEVIRYSDKSKIYIPAYLVYQPYKLNSQKQEKIYGMSFSTGLSCADSLEKSILTGLFECIERDAFILTWICKRKCPTLVLSQVLSASIIEKFTNSGFQLVLKDITHDLNVPTVMAILISENNYPKAVFSAATRFTIKEAAEKAVEEIIGTFMMAEHLQTSKVDKVEDVVKLDDHVSYWAYKQDQSGLSWLLEDFSNSTINIENEGFKFNNLDQLVSHLDSKNIRIYTRDLTPSEFKALGYVVSKCYSPDLQPLHAGFNTFNFKSIRFSNFLNKFQIQGELNHEPHPFP